jgi:hypothetical protein
LSQAKLGKRHSSTRKEKRKYSVLLENSIAQRGAWAKLVVHS